MKLKKQSPIQVLEEIKVLEQQGLSRAEIRKKLNKSDIWVSTHLRLGNLHVLLKAQMSPTVPFRERLSTLVGSCLGLIKDQDRQLEIWDILRQEKNLVARGQKAKKLVAAVLIQNPKLGPGNKTQGKREFDRGVNLVRRGMKILLNITATECVGLPDLESPDGPILFFKTLSIDSEAMRSKIYQARHLLLEKKKLAISPLEETPANSLDRNDHNTAVKRLIIQNHLVEANATTNGRCGNGCLASKRCFAPDSHHSK